MLKTRFVSMIFKQYFCYFEYVNYSPFFIGTQWLSLSLQKPGAHLQPGGCLHNLGHGSGIHFSHAGSVTQPFVTRT